MEAGTRCWTSFENWVWYDNPLQFEQLTGTVTSFKGSEYIVYGNRIVSGLGLVYHRLYKQDYSDSEKGIK